MNLFALSGFFGFITTLCIGIFSLIKATKRLHVIWAMFAFASAVWGLSAYMFPSTLNTSAVFFWLRFGHVGVILLPVLFLHFVYEFLEIRHKTIYYYYCVTAIFFILNITDWLGITKLFIVHLRFVFNSFYVDSPPGLLYAPFVLFFFWTVIFAHYIGIKAYRISTGIKKNQLKYFLSGMAISWGGGGTAFLMVFNIDVYPVYHFTVFLYPIVITYAIFRYRLMDLKVVATNVSIFVFLYLLVLALPFYLGFRYNEWRIATVLAVLLGALGVIVFKVLQEKAQNVLLAKQRVYQKLLRDASKEMLKVHDLDKLLPYIIESVTNAVNPEFSAIYLAQEGDYVLKAWRKINPEPPYGSIASNHPIINVLRNVGPIVFYEEMKDSMPGISLPLHLLISLNIDNRLVGVLLLGKKMDGDMYSSDDLDVFEILARQAALAIDYCMYNREFQNSQRKIYGDELRASVTGMAKTVAHQMVNQLSKFSMPAQYLVMETEKFQEDNAHLIKANPALKNAIDEVLRVSRGIEVNVHKAANMLDKMNYFVKFQSEIVHAHESLDICQLIDLSIIEVRKKHVLQNVAINVSLPGDARIYGIKSMVYDTMFNLLDNAYDAVDLSAEIHSQKEIAEPYKPVIAVTMEEQNDKSVISVSDNGIGINGKIRDKICNPFFTSKSSATASIGIGLYMVKCMVEEIHKGKLWFESEYGVGSSFCVSFPHNKS